MEAYKREFIQFLENAGVLKFGDFTAKSGRKIPYFINAGMIKTGEEIATLGEFYARAYLEKLGDKKTVLYAFWPGEGHGPAVKYQQGWEPKNFCGQGGTDGTNIPQRGQRQSLYKGSWKTMKKGHNYTIEVAFGEAAGGLGGACLGLQKKGKDDDNNFPMFTLEPLDEVPAWGIGETGRYNVTGNFVAR